MMFGLPDAALTIYHSTRPENCSNVAGIMLAATFSSFLTGITELLKFFFMFVAPVLYFQHALLTGLSVFIAASIYYWIAGFDFSTGLVDMVLSSCNPLAVQLVYTYPARAGVLRCCTVWCFVLPSHASIYSSGR